MRTDDLVDRLSQHPLPLRRPEAVLAGGLGAGVIAAFVLMQAWLGVRPDLNAAIHTAPFWIKLVYALTVAVATFPLVSRLSRPAGTLTQRALIALVPSLCVFALASLQLAEAPSSLRATLIMGSSANVCAVRIFILSLPIVGFLSWALRRSAPTKLILAGMTAGLLAGSAGTFIYAFHCDESAMPFVAIWYTLGMSAVGVAGAAMGRFILRW